MKEASRIFLLSLPSDILTLFGDDVTWFQFPNVHLINNYLIVFEFVYLIEILTFIPFLT